MLVFFCIFTQYIEYGRVVRGDMVLRCSVSVPRFCMLSGGTMAKQNIACYSITRAIKYKYFISTREDRTHNRPVYSQTLCVRAFLHFGTKYSLSASYIS